MKTADVAHQPITVAISSTAEDVSTTVRTWPEEVRGAGSPV
jgi:hypothetical protein